jgi:type I restriction enzyme S subunit
MAGGGAGMTKPLPPGWRRVRLGEFITERNGFITLDDAQVYQRITVRLHNKGIELRDEVPGFKIKTKKQKVVCAGDLVVAEIDAKVGGFGIAPPEAEGAIVSSHYFLFEIDQSVCELGYLDACIRKGILQKQVVAVGSTNYAAIRPYQVLDYRIPLPPLAEQNRIADILRAVDEAIKANEEVIARTRDLKKALAHELLTRGLPGRHTRFKDSPIGRIPQEWEVRRLGELLIRIDAGKSPKCEDRPAGPDEWGVLKVSAVSSGCYLPQENKAVPATVIPIPELEVGAGDVLVVRANGVADLVGRAVYVGQSRPKLMLSDKTLRLVQNPEKLDARLIPFLLASKFSRAQIETLWGGSSGQKNISQDALRKITVPVPPVPEQRQIAEALSAFDYLEERAQKAIHHSCEMRRRLMESLLSGRRGGSP